MKNNIPRFLIRISSSILLFLYMTVCGTPGFSANITELGKLIGGKPVDVAVQGNYAYVAAGGILSVINISDKVNPTQDAYYDIPGSAQSVFIPNSGTYAYVAAGSAGLAIVDISNPQSSINVIKTSNFAQSVHVSGNYAYVADSADGLRIIDISNPLISYTYLTADDAYGVYVEGNYAYVAIGDGGLEVVNVSTPSSPQQADILGGLGFTRNITVSGTNAYIVDDSTGLRVIDISTPTAVSEIDHYDTPGVNTHDIFVSGTHAYIADGNAGLQILDISVSPPAFVGSVTSKGHAYGIYVAGNHAYLADGGAGFRVIDISVLNSPVIKGQFNTPSMAEDIFISGNYAYVSIEYNSGLSVIDISSPTAPNEVGFCPTISPALGVFVSGDYAYVADCGAGLAIIDISTPSTPILIKYHDTPEFAEDVYVTGHYAYVADRGAGLRVIDISPAIPFEAGYVDTPGHAKGVCVSGNYAYVADKEAGLRVINISTPTTPSEINFFDTGGSAEDVCVSANYAYIADGEEGLRIINIGNPLSLSEVGFFDTPGNAVGVEISGNYAFVSDSSSGIRMIDISNPSSPYEAGFFDTPGTVKGTSVSGIYAGVADYGVGIWIVQPDIPQILTIDPSSGKNGDRVLMSITGENFKNSCTLSFSGTGITINSLTRVDEQHLEADISISINILKAPAGFRDVIVTNPGGLKAVLTGGFEVIEYIDYTPPTGAPTKPIISQDNVGPREIRISWEIGTSSDPESGIGGYYLEVGKTLDPSDPDKKKYFNGFVSSTTKFVELPEIGMVFAEVWAVNGSGVVASSESAKSDGYDVLDLSPPAGKPPAPVITQDRIGVINVLWQIGSCSDPETGIAGFYLEVGTKADPDLYFGEFVGYVFSKLVPVPEYAEAYARVRAINGAGLPGEFSDLSGSVITLATPTFTAISPASGKKRATFDITLQGTQFSAGASVSFSGSGITVNTVTLVSTQELTVNITISNDAVLGLYDVTVDNNDGSAAATLVNGFEVREGIAEHVGQVRIQGGAKGYTNPSKGETAKIHFKASGPGTVNVTIYTLKGLFVCEKAQYTDGTEDVMIWDCKNSDSEIVASGIYVLYVTGPGINTTKKAAIIK